MTTITITGKRLARGLADIDPFQWRARATMQLVAERVIAASEESSCLGGSFNRSMFRLDVNHAILMCERRSFPGRASEGF